MVSRAHNSKVLGDELNPQKETRNEYDTHFSLELTEAEKSDLVEYLKSLGDASVRSPKDDD